MQQNCANVIEESEIENRYSSMDIPTHGRVPKWLENMSNSVHRSKSVSDNRNMCSGENVELNNNTEIKMERTASEFPLKSTESSRTSSAKYGRRAISSTSNPNTPITKIAEDINEYLVPNLNSLQMNNVTHSKPFSRNEKPLSQTKISTSEVVSYSPSILERENGRKSRAELLNETSIFNDLISTISDQSNKAVPEKEIKNLIKSSISDQFNVDNTNTDDIFKVSDSKLISKTLTPNLQSSKVIFDEIYKNKLQKCIGRKIANSPNKRMKYKKFKYKQGSAITSKKELKPKSGPEIKSEEIFIIPELPKGSKMCVKIFNTWGDKYYVGLNGIELFGSDGGIIEVKKINAPDVNILPECSNDPRVVANLLDGVNRTHDDTHLWLAPYDPGKQLTITIEFEKINELAMMRIWNYNKSRIHSYRGARFVIITLDESPIFKGEVAQACGSVNGSMESFGDTILFTTDESILEKISRNDEAFTTLISTNSESNDKVDRPTTATGLDEPKQRPYTHAFTKKQEEKNKLIGLNRIDLVFVLNWGKSDMIGLTGLEIIGESDGNVTLYEGNLCCNYKGNLGRLIDEENLTNDPKHMWAVKYNPIKNVVLSIIFDQFIHISGLRIWNYNENIESTFAGVRLMKIYIDDKPLPNPLTQDSSFILRRAPGNIHYDYVQEIHFTNLLAQVTSEAIYNFSDVSKYREDSFEQPNMPEGFVFQIVIYTTWGDQYYVGLNGIEIYDHLGRMVLLTENNICAHPESVNVLPGVSGDVRTPDKLIDGINEIKDGSHSWLAPVIPKCLNRIYIVLDQPVTISVIKLWNYFKTPARGVREFGILVDDLLVYNGILDKANEKSTVKYRSILFTSNSDVMRKEMATIVKHSIDSQGTVLTNDKLRMTTGGSLPSVDQSLRPFTSVNHLYRGRTSQSN